MNKIILIPSILICLSISALAQTRYISPAGNDSSNCATPGNPCATITYATMQALAGDTIIADTGTYTFPNAQLIDKSIILMGNNVLNKPVIKATDVSILQVTSDNVTITGLRIEMGLTGNDGLIGIALNGNYNNASISNNEIISTKPKSSGMVFGSYGIIAGGGTGQLVNITGNTIRPQDTSYDAHGRAIGIGLNGTNGPGGIIANNTLSAFYPIQSITNTADLSIDSNLFIGNTFIAYPGSGTSVNLLNNTFSGYSDSVAVNLTSLLEIRAVNNASVLVQGNQFTNYVNIGLLSSAARHVSITENTFSPSATATNFVSIHANTKLSTTGVQNNTYSNQIEILGNTFNPGQANSGAAIIFADHYGVVSPSFDTITIGGYNPNEKNIFDTDILYYIKLDTLSGVTDSVPLWLGSSSSVMLPFTQSVRALAGYNVYGITDTLLLEERMFDSLDFNGIGKIVLFDPLITSLTNAKTLNLNLWPNPTTDFISLKHFSLMGTSQIDIYDMQGKSIYHSQSNANQLQLTIPVQQFSKGEYLVEIKNNSQLYISRFTKE